MTARPHSVFAAPPPVSDPVLRTLSELRSRSPVRIRAALERPEALDPVVTPQVIQLLDRDDVAQAAYETLCKCGDRIAGQLVDGLQDSSNSFNIRKRIPKVLSSCQSRAAWDGLAGCLLDARFEVRTRCAKAMERIAGHHTGFALDQNYVFDVVRREMTRTRKLASGMDGGADGLKTSLSEREAKTVAHIFTLLGLVLPRKPVRQAFRALQAEGGRGKGMALEYLDSILPKDLRQELTAYFEGSLTAPSPAPNEEEVAQFLDEHPSMMQWLDMVEKPAKGQQRYSSSDLKKPCEHRDQIKIRNTGARVCEDCAKTGDSWVHLRLCLTCGHLGCCDSSKNKHATKHFHATQHPLIRSIEPGESWMWCYVDQVFVDESKS